MFHRYLALNNFFQSLFLSGKGLWTNDFSENQKVNMNNKSLCPHWKAYKQSVFNHPSKISYKQL